jgi:hypothetical protein
VQETANLVPTAHNLYMCMTGRYDVGFYSVQP